MVHDIDTTGLKTIRDTLRAQCDQVEELARRTTVRVWRDWHAAYPLEPKPPGSILKSDIVSRLCAVQRSLTGRHALSAYEKQVADDLFVLCVDAVIGWRCKTALVPRLYDIDANLVVTSAAFAWTFGTHEMWKRCSLFGNPVFVEPDMLPDP